MYIYARTYIHTYIYTKKNIYTGGNSRFHFPFKNLGQLLEKTSRTVEAKEYMHKAASIMNDDGLRMYTDLLLPYVYEVCMYSRRNMCIRAGICVFAGICAIQVYYAYISAFVCVHEQGSKYHEMMTACVCTQICCCRVCIRYVCMYACMYAAVCFQFLYLCVYLCMY